MHDINNWSTETCSNTAKRSATRTHHSELFSSSVFVSDTDMMEGQDVCVRVCAIMGGGVLMVNVRAV